MSSSKSTKDLKEIQKWAEARGGKPVKVKSVKPNKKGGGILRIDFPGYSGEDSLEEIPWEDWYKIFEESDLTFLYQDKTAEGKESRFFKLIKNKEEE